MNHKKMDLNPLALAVTLAFTSCAYATGTGTIAKGTGSITHTQNGTQVNQQSDKMVINWDNMDVGRNETLNFNQPGANSAVLNRINSINATQIKGALNANGRVIIVNPNGVLIGNGATVNVGSLIASALNIDDNAFMNNIFQFSGKSQGKVTNEGNITASQSVALIGGGEISNQGKIQSEAGSIHLAAGDSITLQFPARGNMKVKVNKGSLRALIKNGGLLATKNGAITLTAWATDTLTRSAINNSGVIEANNFTFNDSGIYLDSMGTGTMELAGSLSGKSINASADAVTVNNGATLAGSVGITAKASDSYVKLGDARFTQNVNITADNLISEAKESAPQFAVGSQLTVKAASEQQNLSTGDMQVNQPGAKGEGKISGTIINALAENKGSLNIETNKGDIIVNNPALKYEVLSLTSKSGNVVIDNDLHGEALIVNSGNFAQSDTGHIKMNKDVLIYAKNNVIQKANIQAANSVEINSLAGNFFQAKGAKSSADKVILHADKMQLNGDVMANGLSISADNSFTQGAGASLTANTASLMGGDFMLTAGDNQLDSLYFNLNSLNLATGYDTHLGAYSAAMGSLTVNSAKNVTVNNLTAVGKIDIGAQNITLNPYATITGFDDISLSAQNNVQFSGDINASGSLVINAENITAVETPNRWVLQPVLTGDHGVTLTARNDINVGDIFTYNDRANVTLTGNNIKANSVFATNDFSANAAGNITLAKAVSNYNINAVAQGNIEVDSLQTIAGDISLTAKNDVVYSGDISSGGNLVLTGGSIRAQAPQNKWLSQPQLSGNGDIALIADKDIKVGYISNYGKNSSIILGAVNVSADDVLAGDSFSVKATDTINLGQATARNVSLMANGDINWNDITAFSSIKASSQNGAIYYTNLYAPVENTQLSASKGVYINKWTPWWMW
ncbi:filamentous hemagglutinin N-terminal domain-containing protein [Mixta intestinalis]|uniref:Heme/hemopexin-binding protein n=1 Tax=Mixta intestinalis TaxID=1615494 RepID=A0A6P1PXH0_9GAMM|nr:filamentous hemagglutinin N-terminal domain-containing protein [Mixta intestinalis]QHM70415.1 Heme/hemopexin-binding protein [Mixta intestinalis]